MRLRRLPHRHGAETDNNNGTITYRVPVPMTKQDISHAGTIEARRFRHHHHPGTNNVSDVGAVIVTLVGGILSATTIATLATVPEP